jgi:probable phosphoglycerate mutase
LVLAKEQGIDALLEDFGYQREGLYYRVQDHTDKTIAIFSHGGSSAAVIGHLLNIPFPFMCEAMAPDYTAVTIITLRGENGALITPKVELFNDAKHIEGIFLDSQPTPKTTEKVFSL